MATFSVHVAGIDRLLAALARISPAENRQMMGGFLVGAATLIRNRAVQDTIIRGGKGPPDPVRITSRTGTGRRSISVDTEASPASVSVGSHLVYMALHEAGGSVSVPRSTVASHTRTIAFGRRRKPFTVPTYSRAAHTATYPARPWLVPAIELATKDIEALLERTIDVAVAP